MKSASRPPVVGDHAGKTRAWLGDLINHASLLLLEGDDDDREGFLARLSIARFIELHAAELGKEFAEKAQELGASDASLAHATGLREQTVTKKYPNRHRPAGTGTPAGPSAWRRRS